MSYSELSNKVIVLKFGSSVLTSRAAVPAVVHEIYRWYREGFQVIAVVSAIGKSTEELLAQARELSMAPEPWATAELLATGERTSAALVGIALDRAGIPARIVNPREIGLEITGAPLDGEPTAVNAERAQELLSSYPVLVVPGFFGTDASGRTQLLGRGGSDLTAVVIAISLQARCRLVKDCDGVYESDPAGAHAQTLPRRFSEVSYADALQVAGKLIQPKAIAYLEKHRARCEIAALDLPYQTLIHTGGTQTAAVDTHVPTAHSGTRGSALEVVILGCGTVGGGVYQRLAAHPAQFRVMSVLVGDSAKHKAAGVPLELLHTDTDIVRAHRPALVIDALPGASPSFELLKHFLAEGVDVVSANKAVIADHGAVLERIARKSGALLKYSAAVGGSAPMLEVVGRTPDNGPIESLAAVLNGTCNFVLDACSRGTTYAEAVQQAQHLGFAESDPTDDVSGRDAARKIQILARRTFGEDLFELKVQAIDESVVHAARDAASAGESLRQVARARCKSGRITASVRLERVDAQSPFSALQAEWNALTVTYSNGPALTVLGRGAGRWPTTEAVIADVFDTVRARLSENPSGDGRQDL